MKTKRGVDDNDVDGTPVKGGDSQTWTPAQLLHSYLVYIRLSKTIDRYLLMIDQLRSGSASSSDDSQKQRNDENVDGDQGGKQKGKKKKQKEDAAAAQQASEKSKAKPMDLVRLYDTVLQVRLIFFY